MPFQRGGNSDQRLATAESSSVARAMNEALNDPLCARGMGNCEMITIRTAPRIKLQHIRRRRINLGTGMGKKKLVLTISMRATAKLREKLNTIDDAINNARSRNGYVYRRIAIILSHTGRRRI